MSHIRHIFQFVWPYLRRYWGRLLLGVIFGMLAGASNGLFVWLTKTLIERLANLSTGAAPAAGTVLGAASAVQSHVREFLDPWLPLMGRALDWKQITGGIVMLGGPMFLRGTLSYLAGYCMGWVAERAVNDMRVDVFSKLTTLSLDYFHRSTTGDLLTRINGDTGSLHVCLRGGFTDLIKEPVTLLTLLGALFIVDWQLTLMATVFIVAVVLPLRTLGKKARRASQGAIAAGVQQSSQVVEALAGIRVVKAYGLEQEQVSRFRDLANRLVHHGMKSVQAAQLSSPLIETVGMLGFGLLLVWIVGTHRHLADMAAFLTGVMLLQPPLKRIAGLQILFQQSSVCTDRIAQVFAELPTVKEPPQPVPFRQFTTGIQFDNVTFSYGHQPVLVDINLAVPRGLKLGIAGESGSGKSTLVNLLFRFYDPTAGRVLIDGHDLRTIATSDLRQRMALVSQEIVLFDKSIAENIGYGRPGASREEIETAARSAFADAFIRQLPQGFDTRIGERGVTLSGGQRQRIAIARAFVRNAPILVLDEATASLDSQSEAEVQTAIERLAENRTVIVVAHRLSTLRFTNRVIVLTSGRIVEEGDFDGLLRRGGVFAAMAQRQGILPP
jgi:subfamily B ATP-binding cassette protein MsbA